MLIDNLITEYLEKFRSSASPHTFLTYRQGLKDFRPFVKGEEITTDDVARWLASMQDRGLSGKTRSVRLMQIRSFIGWLIQTQRADYTLLYRIPSNISFQKPEPRVATEKEMVSLLLADIRPATRTLILLMGDAGLRAAEAGAVRTRDVDLEGKTIVVSKAKGGRTRVMPILTDRLWLDLEVAVTRGEYVAAGNRALDQVKVWEYVNVACKQAGIRHLNPHSFRHGFAVRCAQLKGVNIRAIQQALGHSDLAQTDRYLTGLVGSTPFIADQLAALNGEVR